jgi:hypothetical protein
MQKTTMKMGGRIMRGTIRHGGSRIKIAGGKNKTRKSRKSQKKRSTR